jgi:hypothetical protein
MSQETGGGLADYLNDIFESNSILFVRKKGYVSSKVDLICSKVGYVL